jgi:solute carrier family 25 carnitine/acylcarnitine transporter 20/29
MQTGTTVGGASQSVFRILRNTMVNEGVSGLYRGVSAPIVAISPIYAFGGMILGSE